MKTALQLEYTRNQVTGEETSIVHDKSSTHRETKQAASSFSEVFYQSFQQLVGKKAHKLYSICKKGKWGYRSYANLKKTNFRHTVLG